VVSGCTRSHVRLSVRRGPPSPAWHVLTSSGPGRVPRLSSTSPSPFLPSRSNIPGRLLRPGFFLRETSAWPSRRSPDGTRGMGRGIPGRRVGIRSTPGQSGAPSGRVMMARGPPGTRSIRADDVVAARRGTPSRQFTVWTDEIHLPPGPPLNDGPESAEDAPSREGRRCLGSGTAGGVRLKSVSCPPLSVGRLLRSAKTGS